jgi:UDP-2-acetamido-2,6-beta-L-arabino-hexul-4-ose reductase
MKTALITGSSGFIGKNLYANLSLEEDVSLITFTKDNSLEDLKELVAKSDFIFHTAGVNRPETEDEFKLGNTDLTFLLVDAIEKTGKKIPIVFTSSIQAEEENPYGTSKKHAEEILKTFSEKYGSSVFIYRLPNVFGKWSKPDYNSVVATFCHNISHDIDIKISEPEKEITFVYIDDVIESFRELFMSTVKPGSFEFLKISRNYTVTLADLAKKIHTYKDIRSSLLLPDFRNPLERYLYATYTSFYKKDDFSYQLSTNRDDRGWLAEFVKSPTFGQIFVSSTNPGYTRGNHWHNTKIEKFLVVYGEGEIQLRNLGDDELITYKVSADSPTAVDIPAGYIHSIKNTGESQMVTIFWSDEILDMNKPDTHYEEV